MRLIDPHGPIPKGESTTPLRPDHRPYHLLGEPAMLRYPATCPHTNNEGNQMSARLLTVYGTRPEAIKLAPLIRALESDPRFDSFTAVTGQHREMLDQVNQVFGIVPDHDLNVFSHGQHLNSLMAKVFEGLDPVLQEVRPDAVIVQGDTSTVAAAAIASFHRKVPVVHVEAGLRSGNINSPFPEEANRRITTQVTTLHLAPTSASKTNLEREGVEPRAIAVTGNTVIDALLHAVNHKQPFTDERLSTLASISGPVLLVTTHRRENWGGTMEGIGRALSRIAVKYPHLTIVVPAHRNPIVRAALLPHLESLKNVTITEPLPYGEFSQLMNFAHIVLTDSGGIQEEAPSLGKPVLVLRENTERPEAIVAGTARLIGTNEERVFKEIEELLENADHYASMANAVNPYGDGKAAVRSVAAIAQLLDLGLRLPDFDPEGGPDITI